MHERNIQSKRNLIRKNLKDIAEEEKRRVLRSVPFTEIMKNAFLLETVFPTEKRTYHYWNSLIRSR